MSPLNLYFLMLCLSSCFRVTRFSDTWVSAEREAGGAAGCWQQVEADRLLDITTPVAGAGTAAILWVCVMLLWMNACHCVIHWVVLRGYWDPVSGCTFIYTLSQKTSIFLFPPNLAFSKDLTDERGGQSFLVTTISVMTTSCFFYRFSLYV